MRAYLSSAALFAVLAAGSMAVSGCETPLWLASHGDVHEHVGEANAKAEAGDAAVAARVDETNAHVASVDLAAKDAVARANAAGEAAKHPFAYTVLMKDDSVHFNTGKSNLSPEAQAFLTDFAQKLKAQDKNVYIEIQGHGDPRGSVASNRQLGEKRADAVKRFLADQGVPLPRMTTISYGEEKPMNSDTAGSNLEENRHVVLIVMG